jgi:AcrR family transcriptional regulator
MPSPRGPKRPAPAHARTPKRQRDPEAKRDRIASAAAALFAESGFDATSTAAVAARAGVSEGIVFHHFGSKQGLLTAVAGHYGRGLARAMFEAEDPEQLPSPERTLRRAFAYVRKHGPLSNLLVVATSPEAQHQTRNAARSEIVGALENAFERWSAEGTLRHLPHPRITAELLFALVEAALTGCFVHGDGSREEEYLREAVACIEGAVLPRSVTPAFVAEGPDASDPTHPPRSSS